MCVHIGLQSREKRVGYIAHSAQLAWPNTGRKLDTTLLYVYKPVMYFCYTRIIELTCQDSGIIV